MYEVIIILPSNSSSLLWTYQWSQNVLHKDKNDGINNVQIMKKIVEVEYNDLILMKSAIANKEFVEHAEHYGNMYGTSKKAVESVMDQGKICILDIVSTIF